eukprot:3402941-Rhodomonas_salina.3
MVLTLQLARPAALHIGVWDPIERNFLIHGGESITDGVLLGDCWFLSVNATWTDCSVTGVAAQPRPRRGHSAVFYKDFLFIFGGCVSG